MLTPELGVSEAFVVPGSVVAPISTTIESASNIQHPAASTAREGEGPTALDLKTAKGVRRPPPLPPSSPPSAGYLKAQMRCLVDKRE